MEHLSERPVEAVGGSFNSDLVKKDQASIEDFEHLEPEHPLSKDIFGADPLIPHQEPLVPFPELSDVKSATLDFLTELTDRPKERPFEEKPLETSNIEDPFNFKPLPPEPHLDFMQAEKGPDKNADLDAFASRDFKKEEKEDEKVSYSPVPDSPRDSPPPVPRHQSLDRDSPMEDEFEPSQTPEPDYEPRRQEAELLEEFEDLPPPLPSKIEQPPKIEVPPPKVELSQPKTESPPQLPEKKKTTPSTGDIGAKDIFSNIGLDAWFSPGRLHPKVESLVYWRDVKKSGVVFGATMVSLLSLMYCSLISVVSYLCLVTLFATISFRIYKNVMQAVQKTSDGHPFKDLLEVEIEVSESRVREAAELGVKHINAWLVELRRLFLVVDLVDSLKFGVCLWALTYVGAMFNGLTLVIMGWIALFTLPKVYENNKQQIDAYLELATGKVSEITNKVRAALPVGKKEAEKPKDQ